MPLVQVNTDSSLGSERAFVVREVLESNSVDGHFNFLHNGTRSSSVPYDAAAENVAEVLSEVGIGRPLSSPLVPLLEWVVTFLNMQQTNVLGIDASNLEGTNPRARVTQIREGETVRGQFCMFNDDLETQRTPWFSVNATVEKVANAIGGLHGIRAVEVSREGPLLGHGGGYVWMLTFAGQKNDVDLLSDESSELIGTDGFVEVSEVQKGNVICGHFVLSFGSSETVPILFDASADALELAMERMGTLPDVQVERSGPDDQHGFSWTVTFLGDTGNDPALASDAGGLSGTGSIVRVEERTTDNALGGSLTVAYDGNGVQTVPFDCSTEDMVVALAAIGVTNATVMRTVSSKYGTLEWLVTLSADMGNTDLIETGDVLLTGWSASSEVVEKLSGASSIGGLFRVQFCGHSTPSMLADVSAAEMKEALETLASLGGEVSVIRSTEGDFGTFSWGVTFASNVDNLANLVVVPVALTGSNPLFHVEEIVAGADVIFGTFRLAYGDDMSSEIPCNAEEDVRDVLEGLGAFQRVKVTRILHSDFGHYEWLVTFVESSHELPLGGGNLELLVGDGASLGGTDVNLTVAAVSDGSASLDGDLQFCFRVLDGEKKDVCTLDLTMGSPGAEGQ